CHYGPGDGLNGPWDTRADLTKFLRWADQSGIHRINLFAAFHSDYRTANRIVARLVRQHPDRFSGFAFVHAERDRGRIRDLVREAVEEHGFRGIKAHRHDADLTREVCEAARAYRLPVLYDLMGNVTSIELFATEYPDVHFIIPHLGSFADDWKAQLNFIPYLERHVNVHTDTSGVRRFDLLEMAVQRAGAHKVLFGSDGPWLHPGVELEKVYALRLPPQQEALVLGGNFLRLTAATRTAPLRTEPLLAASPDARLPLAGDPWLREGVVV
ncbi:MAG: amidohydrolase family protein, partial [Saprospiraceae bacterium]